MKNLRKIMLLLILLGIIMITILYIFIKSNPQSSLKKKLKNNLKGPYMEIVSLKNNFREMKEIKNKIKYDKKIEDIIKKEYSQLYYDFENPYIKINPYGRNPMSALIKFETENPSKIKLILKDKNFSSDDIIQKFEEFKTEHELVIKYLYADRENTVKLIVEDEKGNIKRKEFIIKTESLKSEYPIIVSRNVRKSKEIILLEYGSSGEKGKKPVIIDSIGNIRGGLDTSDYFQNLIINQNQNFVWAKNNKIYEYNLLGKLMRVIDMGIYTAHHDIQQKSDGNYLVTVTKKGSIIKQNNERILTVEDYIIEITSEGEIVKEWDFKKIMDTERKVIADRREDWLHINSIFYDEEKNQMIVSANFQGIFVVDYNDNLEWIISDPIGYNKKFKDKLLSRDESDFSFKFPYGQHEATKLENGNILAFDNNVIHFDGKIDGKLKKLIPENNEYSRAVEYRVDLENMKVYQDWEYIDKKLFSDTISGVKKYGEDYLITYGRLKDQNGNWYGKVRKVNRNKEIEYDFDIINRDNDGAALYRSQILNLD